MGLAQARLNYGASACTTMLYIVHRFQHQPGGRMKEASASPRVRWWGLLEEDDQSVSVSSLNHLKNRRLQTEGKREGEIRGSRGHPPPGWYWLMPTKVKERRGGWGSARHTKSHPKTSHRARVESDNQSWKLARRRVPKVEVWAKYEPKAEDVSVNIQR